MDSRSSELRRRYGVIAVALWFLATICSAVDALLAFDRIKVLVFTGGLLMMDIAAAVLFSLAWFLSRDLLGPLADYEAALEYGFRAGRISQRPRQPGIHVVLPLLPQQQIATSNGTDRTSEQQR